MKTSMLLCTLFYALLSSCSPSKPVGDNSEMYHVRTSNTPTPATNTWIDEPHAECSKIKVIDGAVNFDNLKNVSLANMGYQIVESTENSLITNEQLAWTEHIRYKIWTEDNDLILSTEIAQFADSGFGGSLTVKGYTPCSKGDTTTEDWPDCWRALVVMSNKLEGKKQYQ